jgi:hypothetical protein
MVWVGAGSGALYRYDGEIGFGTSSRDNHRIGP